MRWKHVAPSVNLGYGKINNSAVNTAAGAHKRTCRRIHGFLIKIDFTPSWHLGLHASTAFAVMVAHVPTNTGYWFNFVQTQH